MNRVRRTALALLCLSLWGVAGCGAGSTGSPAALPPAAAEKGSTLHLQRVEAQEGVLPEPLDGPAVAVSGSRLYIFSGLSRRGFDPSILAWRPGEPSAQRVGAMPAGLHDGAAVALGEAIYVFGGGESQAAAGVYRFSPPEGRVSWSTRLPLPLADLGGAAVGGSAVLVGGWTGKAWSDAVFTWSPGGRFRAASHLPEPVRYAAVNSWQGRVWVFGGLTPRGLSSRVYAVDVAAGSAVEAGSLPEPLAYAAAVPVGRWILVVGGRTPKGPTAAVLAFNPRSRSFSSAGRLPRPVWKAAAVALGGRVYVLGGYGDRSVYSLSLQQERPFPLTNGYENHCGVTGVDLSGSHYAPPPCSSSP